MKKPIVAVNGRFFLQPITGVQRYACELLEALGRLSPGAFDLLCLLPPGGSPPEIPGVKALVDDGPAMPGVLWQQVRLPWLARRAGAKLLWSPSNIAPVVPGMPQLVTVFDGSVYAGPEWFNWKFRAYYKAIFASYRFNTAAILTCSEFSKAEIEKHLGIPRSSISVAYGAVASRFKPVRGASPVGANYVLSLGSRDPRKNLSSLLKAWGQLPAEIKAGRRLVIAGGKQSTFSEERLEPPPQDVFFAGYVKDADLPALYSNADCFVYPSLYEGFGLPPLEAMACGCPVIASKCASLPEVCGAAAVYVDPREVSSVSAALSEVLGNAALRAGLVEKGFANIKRFSWEDSAKRAATVIEASLPECP